MNKVLLKHSVQTAFPWPRTLVTGATSGIGLALTRLLAGAGAPVLALGRKADALEPLQAVHPNIEFIPSDLSDLASLSALAADLAARYPDLACLINNAGLQHNVRFDEAACTADSIRYEIDVNLTAPIVLTRALLPHLASLRSGWVVNVTSGLAFAPKQRAAVYSATKAGLHLFSQALRLQLQAQPVQVVEAVMPLVDTPMTQGRGLNKLSADEAASQIVKGLRTGRETIWVGKAKGIPWLQRISPGMLGRILRAG